MRSALPPERRARCSSAARKMSIGSRSRQASRFRLRPRVALAAAGVTVEAIGVALDQRRAVVGPGAIHRFACRFVDGEHVLAVDGDAGEAVAHRAIGEPRDRGLVLLPRELAVVIVLDHEDRRQLEQRREVECLVPGALVGRAVTGEAHRDAAVSLILRRERCSDRDRRSAADDAVGADDADVEVGDVHRATLAVAVPGRFAEQLGEHQPHVATLGDAVTVAAVSAGDRVVGPEVGADADGHRLLASVEVHRAGDSSPARPAARPPPRTRGIVTIVRNMCINWSASAVVVTMRPPSKPAKPRAPRMRILLALTSAGLAVPRCVWLAHREGFEPSVPGRNRRQ